VSRIRVTIDDDGVDELLHGPAMRRSLDRMGFMVLARAIPKTGVDSGQLRASMDSAVVEGDQSLEVVFGSNVSREGQAPVEYSEHHWAPGRPGGRRPGWRGTRPWSRAFRELGIPYTNDRGYEV
jgi:hypothetical protein